MNIFEYVACALIFIALTSITAMAFANDTFLGFLILLLDSCVLLAVGQLKRCSS